MKKGFALIAVLTVAVIVGIGIITILQLLMGSTALQKVSANEIRMQYLAEAGLQNAIYDCRAGGCAGLPGNYTIDGQTVTITKTSLGNGTYQIDSTVVYNEG